MPKIPLRRITDVTELQGVYVLLRTSLNVPITDGVVLNQFRIVRGLATLQYLTARGARVIMCGHIGSDGSQTMQPIASILSRYVDVVSSPEVSGAVSKNMRDALQDGQVLLLENLRKDPREKQNDIAFARELADLADIYVNDAFPASHRQHASMVGVPQFLPSYVGMNFVHEYEELIKAQQPKSPALFMLGGAKFDTKMPLVEKFLDIYDHIFIGGALANDFFKAKGYEVGNSLVSDVDLKDSPLINNPKIILPVDVHVIREGKTRMCAPDAVESGENILDAGPETVAMLASLIANAKTILWNGPLGNYEAGFEDQTIALAKVLAESSAYTVVGGGDTVAAIESLACQEKFGFLSTAGGAMLTFLKDGTLPAIQALTASPGNE